MRRARSEGGEQHDQRDAKHCHQHARHPAYPHVSMITQKIGRALDDDGTGTSLIAAPVQRFLQLSESKLALGFPEINNNLRRELTNDI